MTATVELVVLVGVLVLAAGIATHERLICGRSMVAAIAQGCIVGLYALAVWAVLLVITLDATGAGNPVPHPTPYSTPVR